MEIRKDAFWRVEKKDSHYPHHASSKARQPSTERYLPYWRSKVSALSHHKTITALSASLQGSCNPRLLILPASTQWL